MVDNNIDYLQIYCIHFTDGVKCHECEANNECPVYGYQMGRPEAELVEIIRKYNKLKFLKMDYCISEMKERYDKRLKELKILGENYPSLKATEQDDNVSALWYSIGTVWTNIDSLFDDMQKRKNEEFKKEKEQRKLNSEPKQDLQDYGSYICSNCNIQKCIYGTTYTTDPNGIKHIKNPKICPLGFETKFERIEKIG